MVRPDEISTVVGLFRVSTEIQEREGYSLQAQQTAYARDCRAYDWRSFATFEGYESGSALSQRKTIHELISLVRERHPDAVWVIEQSRLTRGDELDVAVLLRDLRENGTKVVTERGNVIDPADLEGAFTFRLKALMDRREWEVISARNKRGKNEKAQRGLSVNGRPAYGYTITGDGRDKGLRVPVPNEAAIVRSIFEWTADGISMRKIIQRLFEQAISAPTQSGHISGKRPERFKDGIQLWGRTTIRRMLKNPIYLGVSYRNCWVKRGNSFVFEPDNPAAIWVEGAHEPIVTQEIWDTARARIKGLRNQKHNQIHMLTGLLVCPVCGNTFTVTTSTDNDGTTKRAYYYCRSKRQKKDEYGNLRRDAKACSSRWLPLEKTDKLVWEAFIRLITSPDMVERYIASAEVEKRRTRLRVQIASLKEEAAKVETMMARAREKLLTEILTDGEYLKERERLETQLRGIQKRAIKSQAELKSTSKDAARQVIDNLTVLKLGEKKLSLAQRSQFFHAAVRRVVPRDLRLSRIDIELYVQDPANGEESKISGATFDEDSAPTAVTMPLVTVGGF